MKVEKGLEKQQKLLMPLEGSLGARSCSCAVGNTVTVGFGHHDLSFLPNRQPLQCG